MSIDLKIRQKGFISLVSVLVAGAVGLSIAISLLLLGLGATRTSFAILQSNQAMALANACAEKAIYSLLQDLSYAGETISLGQGSCTVPAPSGVGDRVRTINATGTVGTIVRKVQIVVARVKPQIQLTSWQEVQ